MFPTPMIAVVTALSIRLRFARRSRQRSLLEYGHRRFVADYLAGAKSSFPASGYYPVGYR